MLLLIDTRNPPSVKPELMITSSFSSFSMPENTYNASRRAVRIWLAVVAALIVLMVIVGGATRLTGSGLSITEWQPVTGILLPLSEASWMIEFDKYRATPQYQFLNSGMSLNEFQFIYLWEWGHRQLGRLIGVVYLAPLLWFAYRGTVRGRFLAALLLIGVLGGAQGGIGWAMVTSGLKPGMIAVAPVKLMLHLLAACGLFIVVVWVTVGLRNKLIDYQAPSRLRFTASLIIAAIMVQIALGALVAGLNAGMSFNTWPLMDGRFIPEGFTLLPLAPWWRNIIESIALVQFNHRIGAYLLLALVIWHVFDAQQLAPDSKAVRTARVLAILVAAQAAIGIVTLLLIVPFWAALLHQAMAVLLLGHAVAHRRLMSPARVFPIMKPAGA